MQEREWLYYLLDSDGRSYYIDNGVIVVSSTPRPLPNTPSGWQDISIGWERNLTTWGMVRNFTLPLEFVIDGADILRHLFYTTTIENVVRMLIQRQALFIDANNYYQYYKYFYRGEIDLSTFEDEETKVSVSIMEGGLSKNIKANENTVYEIPDTDVVVKMDGTTLVGTKRFTVLNPTYFHAVNGAFTVKEMPPMYAIDAQSEGSFFNIYFAPTAASVGDINYSFIDGEDLTESDKYNVSVTADVVFKTISIKGSVSQVNSGSRVGLDFILETNTGRVINLFSLNQNVPVGGVMHPFNLSTGPITIFSGERFFIYHRPNANQLANRWYFSDDTEWIYNTLDKVPVSYVKALKVRTAFSKLIGKIGEPETTAASSLLDSKPNFVILSGDHLRRLEGAVVKTSLRDFETSMNTVLNTGSGVIADKYYIESKGFFLEDANVIALGVVKDVKVSLMKDVMGNVIKIGYPPKDSDDVNGKYSFNNTNVYTSPVKRVVKEIAIVSKYVTDPYVIEIYRANLEQKNTTDNNKDSSVFLLNIDYANPQTLAEDTDGIPAGTTYYNLKRVTYDSWSGVEDITTLYNIEELTPNRLLYVHASYLNALFYQFAGQQVVFRSTDKNKNLYTQVGTAVHDEDANYTLTNSPMLFKPYLFEITPPGNAALIELLEANPNRCFSFIHPNGRTYRGFNIKIGIAANSEEEQAYQLLAVSNQDLTTLKTW